MRVCDVRVRCPWSQVPKLGITCSNRTRLLRVASGMDVTSTVESSWGPMVITGKYKGVDMFLALAPVGVGSGLVYTEL